MLKDNTDKLKHKSLSTDESSVKRAKEMERMSALRAEQYLEMIKESLCRISLDIIERCDVRTAVDIECWQSDNFCCDSQGVVIVISNFLLDSCRLYPSLESSIVSELLRRIKLSLEDPRRQSKDDLRLPSVSNRLFANPTNIENAVPTTMLTLFPLELSSKGWTRVSACSSRPYFCRILPITPKTKAISASTRDSRNDDSLY